MLPTMAEVMNLIGEVAGKTAIILDDMVDTAGPSPRLLQLFGRGAQSRFMPVAPILCFQDQPSKESRPLL